MLYRVKQRERGYALMTAAACSIGIIAMTGLSVDLGRMYIARNEAQTFADSAALTAAVQLDGTLAGLTRARSAVTANTNRWHLGTTVFSGTQTEFATLQTGPWNANPASAAGVLFVRVRATTNPPLYFIPIVAGSSRGQVDAASVAGQVPKTGFREGSFPFSPIAHDAADPNFGLVPGHLYTLRWAAEPKLHHSNVCEGDDIQSIIDAANATGPERGFIEESSAENIRQTIEADRMTRPLAVGDTVVMSGGAKQTQQDSIVNRVRQDTDLTATTYAEYRANRTGNGRRVILAPVNTWNPDYRVLGFAAFFLTEPSTYLAANGGNKPFCAEYVGNYVQGSDHNGAGGPGAYVVRLVL